MSRKPNVTEEHFDELVAALTVAVAELRAIEACNVSIVVDLDALERLLDVEHRRRRFAGAIRLDELGLAERHLRIQHNNEVQARRYRREFP